MPAKRNPLITPKMRRERWRVCADYIARAGSIPAAMKLAKKDGKSFNTSVWISALGKMLEKMPRG